jgi:hypothetical protein
MSKRAKRRPHPELPRVASLALQLKEERDERTHFLRTIAELRWAIHDLFAHFEQHTGGYSHAEMARVEEIREMAPKPVCRVII